MMKAPRKGSSPNLPSPVKQNDVSSRPASDGVLDARKNSYRRLAAMSLVCHLWGIADSITTEIQRWVSPPSQGWDI